MLCGPAGNAPIVVLLGATLACGNAAPAPETAIERSVTEMERHVARLRREDACAPWNKVLVSGALP